MSNNRRSLLLASLSAMAATSADAQSVRGPVNKGPPTLSQDSMPAMRHAANTNTVGIIAGGVDGTYARIASDLAAVLDSPELRILPVLGKGSIQNVRDIVLLRGIDVGIVQSDVLPFMRRRGMLPGIDTLVQYVTKLYDEEIHLLARDEITSIGQLEGRPVNVDVTGSGTSMTASLMFESLGISPRLVNDPQDVALDKLRAGSISAMVFVAGKPTRIFASIPRDSGLRLIPIPATPALLDAYLPSVLTSVDYPALIAEGVTVDTIAVGAVMAVYGWPQGGDRHRTVARFVNAFRSRFSEFLRPPRHPKWREVNLEATLPGWTRFNPEVVAPVTPGTPIRRRYL